MRISSSRIRTVSALFLLLILLLSGLTGCIFTQKPKEFTLTQDEKNINDVYDKDGLSPLCEHLEYDETQFLSLWNQGFGSDGGKP